MKLLELFEGISPIVYHYTSIVNATSIIAKNQFDLSTSFGTDAEGWLAQKNKIFYLSTTRHLLGGFHRASGTQGVMLNLDGDRLGRRYSGAPVDYWGDEFRKLDPTGAEAEDRIYHSKPVITNAIDYIKEVHVYIRKKDWHDDNIRRGRRLFILLKQNNIPHYFYDNHKDWLVQNKKNSQPFPALRTPAPGPGYYRKRKPFAGYMELFTKSNTNELSKQGKRQLDYLYNKHDFVTQLKNEIHNNKSKVEESGLGSLLELFKQMSLKTSSEVFDYLYDKWISR